MSHHFDSPTGRDDPRLNICDFYLFEGDSDSTVMAMTVNPQADAAKAAPFRPEGVYAFRFDTDGDSREDVSFTVRFADTERGDGVHRQSFQVRHGIGSGAGGIEGDSVVAEGTTEATITGETGIRAFAGVTGDAFAADAHALETFEAAYVKGAFAPESFDSHQDFFAPRRVAAIVLQVPNDMLGTGVVDSWTTITLTGHAPDQQVARWGLPLITHLFLRDDQSREDYNRSQPSTDEHQITERIAAMVRGMTQLAGSADDPDAYARRVLGRFGDLTLPYEIGSTASFDYTGFNGRAPHDDVMDVMLSLSTNTALGDGVSPRDRTLNREFPYLAASAP